MTEAGGRPLQIGLRRALTKGIHYWAATSLEPEAALQAIAGRADHRRTRVEIGPSSTFRLLVLATRSQGRKTIATTVVGSVAPRKDGSVVWGVMRPQPRELLGALLITETLGMVGMAMVIGMVAAMITGDLAPSGAAPGFAIGGVLLGCVALWWYAPVRLRREAQDLMESALGAPLLDPVRASEPAPA